LRLGLIHRCCRGADGLPGRGELGFGTLHGDAERVGSMRYSGSPVWTVWLSCTATSTTFPETSGTMRTTKARTLASLV
jgi:hypothetical protein